MEKLRVLFAAPPGVFLMGECGGVRKLMEGYQFALHSRGHKIDYLETPRVNNPSDYDLCHLFMANGESCSIGSYLGNSSPLVVSPIIDKNYPCWMMRLNRCFDRWMPFMYSHLGRCAVLCEMAMGICLMSRFERSIAKDRLAIKTPASVVPCPLPGKQQTPMDAPSQASIGNALLFVGDIGNPRKNILRLIRAISGTDLPLVMAGTCSHGKYGQQVLQAVQKNPAITYLGVVSEEQKISLIQKAGVFVLPSEIEGIGLAAVEAGLVGKTIVVTGVGGPPDYFRDQAYYVNPRSVADIRTKILKAIEQPLDCRTTLADRCSLEKAGMLLEDCYLNAIDSFRKKKQRR